MIHRISVFFVIVMLGLGAQHSFASSLRYCDDNGEFDPEAQDRLIRIAAIVKGELDKSGKRIALISRSGLALQRFDHRYSHAGITLQASENTPWSVRQLYYACDEKRPRIFDQGMAGFVMGSNDASRGYLSIVFLPDEASAALERTALDDRLALQLLASTYSANAYAFAERYQNCNQWLAELLAVAWSEPPQAIHTRTAAQQWLQSEGYSPSMMRVGWRPLIWLAGQVQWLHNDDHPPEDLDAAQYRVSMPAALEAFVQKRFTQASRTEICYTRAHAVIRHGGAAMDDSCNPLPGDQVVPLEAQAFSR